MPAAMSCGLHSNLPLINRLNLTAIFLQFLPIILQHFQQKARGVIFDDEFALLLHNAFASKCSLAQKEFASLPINVCFNFSLHVW